MKQALVLGGGGVIGVAWESGLLHGLVQAGFDPRTIDVFVGTSAGAITGAPLAAGKLPPPPEERAAEARAASPANSILPPKMDPQVLGAIFGRWTTMQRTTREDAAAIGALAVTQYRDAEEAMVERITRMVGLDGWPERAMLVCTVDTASGERKVLTKASDVPIGRAVAASSAVPGLFPSVTIHGRLYMDGQVHSSTNADVLLSDPPQRVLIAMPTNAVTAAALGGHAERMLEAELHALRAAGVGVSVRTPRPEDGARLGTNLMDMTRAPEAYAVGLETGRAWAEELR